MTEEALQKHKLVEEDIDMMNRRMLQGLTGQETDELYRLLDIVMKNLEEMDEERGDGADKEEEMCVRSCDEAQEDTM